MGGDGRVDEIAAQLPDARQRAVLVSTGEPAVADKSGLILSPEDDDRGAGAKAAGRTLEICERWGRDRRRHD
jgi:hypothetical protein